MKGAGEAAAFFKVLDANLERVHVMEQRGFMTMRLDSAADLVPGADDYVRAVNAYNRAFDDHQSFERSYSSDISQKTRANALILDQKHEALKEKFMALKPVILALKEKNV